MNFIKLTLVKTILDKEAKIDSNDNPIWINVNKMLCFEPYRKGGSIIISDNGESRFLVSETPDVINAKISKIKYRVKQ